MQYLIDEGMKEVQGPALWVYNNAVFTDSDLQNIVRLGGETKEKDFDKIGQFFLLVLYNLNSYLEIDWFRTCELSLIIN